MRPLVIFSSIPRVLFATCMLFCLAPPRLLSFGSLISDTSLSQFSSLRPRTAGRFPNSPTRLEYLEAVQDLEKCITENQGKSKEELRSICGTTEEACEKAYRVFDPAGTKERIKKHRDLRKMIGWGNRKKFVGISTHEIRSNINKLETALKGRSHKKYTNEEIQAMKAQLEETIKQKPINSYSKNYQKDYMKLLEKYYPSEFEAKSKEPEPVQEIKYRSALQLVRRIFDSNKTTEEKLEKAKPYVITFFSLAKQLRQAKPKMGQPLINKYLALYQETYGRPFDPEDGRRTQDEQQAQDRFLSSRLRGESSDEAFVNAIGQGEKEGEAEVQPEQAHKRRKTAGSQGTSGSKRSG